MFVRIEGPLSSLNELPALESLWATLHAHHRAVATYQPLVSDAEASWERRRAWYAQLLRNGGALFVARDHEGNPKGYAVTETVLGADDTFEVVGGIVELLSLVVAEDARDNGIGARLMDAVQTHAARQGVDTLKAAVMAGNGRARRFYERMSFEAGEEVLYRKI